MSSRTRMPAAEPRQPRSAVARPAASSARVEPTGRLRAARSVLGLSLFIAAVVTFVTHGWDLRSYTEVDLANPYAGIDR